MPTFNPPKPCAPFSLSLVLGLVLALGACGGSSSDDSDAAPDTPPPPLIGERSGFHNILPPGQKGVFNVLETLQALSGNPPPHTIDQLQMYDALLRDGVVPGFRDELLDTYFKQMPISIAPQDVGRQYHPGGRSDVTVFRDRRFDVPHIVGTTREGTTFASGYVSAEDRLFLMDVLRHVGRARMAEFLGPSASNIAMDRSLLDVAPYKEVEYTQMFEDLRNAGALGELAMADFISYTAGINQYIAEARLDPSKLPAEYPALQIIPANWRVEDIAALGGVIGAFFGKGGGNELRNYCALRRTETAVGSAAESRAIFDDMMMLDDPESPRHVDRVFPYQTNLGTVNPASLPAIDCASLQPIDANGPGVQPGLEGVFNTIDAITGVLRAEGQALLDAGPLGQLPFNLPTSMSNALLVTGDRTRSGRPVAVMGPQLAFFMPQIFTEKSIIGPGIRARGAGFPGTDVYVTIGRGDNYAWSATTSRGDLIDHFILLLCNPAGGTATINSMGYQHNGACKPIESFMHNELALPSAGGIGTPQLLQFRIERTPDYGPLIARGRLDDGRPIAIANHRSTYFREMRSIAGFALINDPEFMAGGPEAFREAMSRVDYVFNWLYVDSQNIAYQHSCLCPRRAPGTEPLLPKLGDGRFDWTGYLGKNENPHVVNPAKGYISSWNNKQAPGWGTADDNPWWGPAFRPIFFERGISATFADGVPETRASILDIVQDSATIDWRGQQLVPLLHRVMGVTPPSGIDPRTAQMMSYLIAWNAGGGHRIDRDNNGAYEHAQAIAIMDAWWEPLIDTVFDSKTGGFLRALGLPLHQAPQLGQGFAFGTGPYSHFHKDLRQVLGDPVSAPFHRTYCGNGNRTACAAELWASLAQTATNLQQASGSADPAAWQRSVASDNIRHSAAGVVTVPQIPFQNRPTYQLVIEVQ